MSKSSSRISTLDIDMEMEHFDWNHADHMYIIPQEKNMRDSLLLVDRNCREEARRRFGIYIQHDWEATTITVTMMEFAVTALEKFVKSGGNSDFVMSFFGLIDFYLSIQHSEHGEKEGNINIVFTAGSEMNAELERAQGIPYDGIQIFNQMREERVGEKLNAMDFFNELLAHDEYLKKLYVNIENTVRLELSKKYNIVIPNKIKDANNSDFRVIAIAYSYILNLIDVLISEAIVGTGHGMPMKEINFCDVFEMKCFIRDKGPAIRCTPGYSSKLIVKGDDITDGDDYYDGTEEESDVSVY